MKVLLSTPPADKTGGVTHFLMSLRTHLSDDVLFFTIGRRNGEPRWLTPIRLMGDYIRFVWVLWRKPIDLVHLNPSLGPFAVWRDGLFILIARTFGKKAILFFHGWDKTYESSIRRRGLWLFRLVYLRASAFIVLADAFRESLRSMGYAGPVEVMKTVFDKALLSQAGDYPHRTDIKDPFNILFLTRIERQKGIMESLQAFAILQARYPNVAMMVAGTGTALPEARSYVSEHGISSVTFAGYVRDNLKAEAFNHAHCYLFPSYTEGMPVSVVEAMAFGLPVVTRSVGALVDFFVDGEMGFITESKDPACLAKLLERLLLSPDMCESMSRRSRAYAQLHFAPELAVERLTAIYQSVISAP